jgi:hypothetical protein
MRSTVSSVAKRYINFAPTLYYPDLITTKIPNLIALKDVVYPYTEVGKERTLMAAHVSAIHRMYPGLRIHLMIYAEGTRFYGTPTAATVDLGVKLGKTLPGVVSTVIYNQQLN